MDVDERVRLGKGSGRSSVALTVLKIAVVAPMPIASVTIATDENVGVLRNCRSAYCSRSSRAHAGVSLSRLQVCTGDVFWPRADSLGIVKNV